MDIFLQRLLVRFYWLLMRCGLPFIYKHGGHCSKATVSELNTSYTALNAAPFYNRWFYHVMMLDKVRNKAYRKVIKQSVNGKTVIDGGAGKFAIWGVEAIKQGASKVYSIEENEKAYSYAEKITKNIPDLTMIQGLTSSVHLASLGGERAQALVFEYIGCVASDEGAAFSTMDMKQRLLVDNPTLIPSCCHTYIAPVSQYQMNYLPTLVNRLFGGENKISLDPHIIYAWYNFPMKLIMGNSVLFESLQFNNDYKLIQEENNTITISQAGDFFGFLLWIELVVDDATIIDSLHQKTSWAPVFVPIKSEPVFLSKGDEINLLTNVNLENQLAEYHLSYSVTSIEGKELVSGTVMWA